MRKLATQLSYFAMVLIIFSGCKSVGLLSEDNAWLPKEIESIGTFFKIYIILQISIIIIGLIFGSFLGNAGYIISLIIHFIWIVTYRDYGFWKVLFLFGMFSIISLIFSAFSGRGRT